MRIMFLVLISIALFVNDSFCNNNNPDMEYVWARSGLNVRSGPGTSFGVIEKLVFGDSVLIISKTGIKYNVSGISNVDSTQHYSTRYEKKGAYILYGKWIEIYTPNGEIGFVINHYVLRIKPNLENQDISFREMSRDTVSLFENDGESNIAVTYTHDISALFNGTQFCHSEVYSIPEFTLQEAFIMLFHKKMENLVVIKNWPNELKLSDGWMNEYSFIVKDGVVYYSFITCC